MSDIRWEDPPVTAKGGGAKKWPARLVPLIEHPKRWAIIHVSPTRGAAVKMVNSFRHGGKSLPPGRFEFASRTVDGEHRVYARYLGPDEDGAS